MPKEEKCTEAELERRIDMTVDLLLSGMGRLKIWQYVAKNDAEAKKTLKAKGETKWIIWNVSQRTVDRYIAAATESIKTTSKTDRDTEIGKALGRLDWLYNHDLMIQDYKAALAVIRERSLLLGLNAPTKIAPTDPSGNNSWEPEVRVYMPDNGRGDTPKQGAKQGGKK
jgi:hypothetical protein